MARSILVLDDEAGIVHFVTEVLQEEGYRVMPCHDAREALALLESADGAPDLILLDIRMPGMDGWEFASELRARGVEIPLLVMTAASQARQAAEEVGQWAISASHSTSIN